MARAPEEVAARICSIAHVVKMLVDQKIISLDVKYVDGTNIDANVNKYTFVWKKSMDAERKGRRLSPPTDVPPAARKRVPRSAAGVRQA